MIGKIAAFRKMPVSDTKIKPTVKVSEERASKIAKAKNAKLYIIPNLGVIWLTDGDAVDALSGKVVSGEIKKLMKEKYVTTVDFGKLESGVKSMNARASSKGIDNDQGAVFRADDDACKDDIDAAEESMELPYNYWYPWSWDDDADDYDVVTSKSTVNYILGNFEAVYYSGHGNRYCIQLGDNKVYCTSDIASGRQTRLFVVAACYAGGNTFGERLVQKGVECVVGASSEIADVQYWWGYSACADWVGSFWDWATGNVRVVYQKTAHEARIEANTVVWKKDCNLDAEKGNCNIYI